jgi:hypothetical protein
VSSRIAALQYVENRISAVGLAVVDTMENRRGPGRRRHDGESMSIREVVSTSEPRRVTDVKVFAYDGVESAKCRLRHISVDGAFIETKNFPLTKGTNLELVLKIRRGGKPTHCRLLAEIIRVEEDGAAVMFGDLDEELCNILLDIVKPFKQKPNARRKL